MTDIIERLRANGLPPPEILDEAAAEIVRLRAALKAIECGSIDHTDACRLAGRALEPKP